MSDILEQTISILEEDIRNNNAKIQGKIDISLQGFISLSAKSSDI